MKKETIHTLFGTPFYMAGTEFDTQKVYDVLNKCVFVEDRSGPHITEEINIIDRIPGFRYMIEEQINNFLYNYIKIKNTFKYYIVDSWFIKIPPGRGTSPHMHSNSLFSGVYYFEEEYQTKISFKNPYISNNFTVRYEIEYSEKNQFNSNVFYVTPLNNSILLFPSRLEHMVEVNETDSDRYSFAFNIMPYNFKSTISGSRILE